LLELLYKDGYKVVAVSDYQGDIYSSQGLDILSIRQYSVGAFMVWAIAIGGKPFISISWYHPIYGSIFDSTLYSGYSSYSSRKT
jgi:Glutamate dehydrogenase/leucine dehydrogenase